MKDVFGNPQTVLVIGGNSEIATAILKDLLNLNRVTKVILVTREGTWNRRHEFESLAGFSSIEVSTYSFSQFSVLKELNGIDLDICIIATGFLPKINELSSENVTDSLTANLTVPALIASDVALHMKKQAHGLIVGLSSIAAVRVRPDNWIYGFAKSAFDQFLQNMAKDLKGTGVSVLIIRSGMVRTKMSSHLKEAPLTVDPEEIAYAIRRNLRSDSAIIWVPKPLRILGFILRLLPYSLLKRLKS
jgi:decaprenylphospho-beta-D-erythro-pentofuranosid-2-ulose 2-reductase